MKKILLLVTLVVASIQMVQAQNRTVTGRITSETGEGLPGANILIKGTTTGTITDFNGNFSLNDVTADAVLQVSSIGYLTQELTVGNQSTVNFQMAVDVVQLSEIVVTGYFTEQKKDIVGSVSVIKTSDMLTNPSANITQQLQGRAAGVTVQTDGSPGGSGKVRIRGFGSFGSNDPLYIIDGVPVTGNDAISNLNPNDVESMQVLKDAAAASVYGARASNGVIIVTTKKGQAGAARLSYDGYYATNYFEEARFPDLLNTQEYGDLIWKQFAGTSALTGTTVLPNHLQYGNGAAPFIPEYILSQVGATRGGAALEALRISDPALFAFVTSADNYDFKTGQITRRSEGAGTEWFKEVYNAAKQMSHQISMSGGSDAGTYAVSMNYFTQDNTYSKYHFYDRYTIRANTSFKLRPNIRAGENMQISYRSSNGSSESASTVWSMHPIVPVYDIMGNPSSSAAPGISGANAQSRNPVTEPWRNRFNRSTNFGIFGNVWGEVDIINGLTARTQFGIDKTDNRSRSVGQRTYEHAENSGNSSLGMTSNAGVVWTWTNTLSYSRTFAEQHVVKVLLGTEAINDYGEDLSASRQDFDEDQAQNPLFHSMNVAVGAQTNSGTYSRESLASVFGRVDYAFADRYLFNATIRSDQSSKFAESTRQGNFPSVAVGWRLSSEQFMQGINAINDLKLRASWGKIGNQSGLNASNQYTTYVSSTNEGYPISGANNNFASSYTQSRVGNPNARWEENITTNVGVDATLFNNSLDVSVEWYNKETSGLLVTNLSVATGPSVTQPAINIGNMVNKGIDVSLNKRGNIITGLKYDVGVTFTHYKNEVIQLLDNPLYEIRQGGTRGGNVTLTKPGQPVSLFDGYQIDGFFSTQEEVDAYTTTTYIQPGVGKWRLKDVNEDGAVDALDRQTIGSPHPDFQMGLNLGLTYQNFDLTAFLFWNQGNEIFNQSLFWVDFNSFNTNRSAQMLYNSWTPELGDNAKLPVYDYNDATSYSQPIEYFVEDASYLRLKTFQLGYTLPQSLLSKLNVSKLRIYAQSQNLFTLTHKDFRALDADQSLRGGDLSMGVVDNITPTPKQMMIGLNLGF